MQVIINRIEDNTAVLELENGARLNAPAALFENAAEGRIYDIIQNPALEKRQREKNSARLASLFGGGKQE